MRDFSLSELLEIVYAHNPLAIAVFDMEMRYLFASNQWYQQYQIKDKNIIGKSHYEIFPEFKDMPEFLEIHQRVLNGETMQGEDDRLLRDDGSVQYQRWIMRPWYYPDTQEQGGAFIYTEDITDKVTLEEEKNKLIDQLKNEIEIRKAYEEKLKHLAITDDLTGLFNRRHFTEILHNEINRITRHNDNLSILLVDIDHFKKVNDTLGHDVGDKVLQALSRLLQENVRNIDKLCRWGGEEFIALLPYTSSDTAITLAERLRKQVEAIDFPDAGNITISIGVATHIPGETINTLIKHADQALYTAKHNGRNQVVEYQPD